MRLKQVTVTIFCGLALTLAGCGAPTEVDPSFPASSAAEDVLTRFGFESTTAQELIDELEAVPLEERSDQFLASVRPDAVVVIDAATQEEASLPLPEDQFYLSVAPYLSQTHDCYFHSLTTCVGELRSTDLDVSIVTEDGTTVLEETVTTADNGFAGFWLPKGIEGTISIEYDGKAVEAPFTTALADAKTCETELQLT